MIDCFIFFNEFDLLDIRLNSYAPYMERFVLCECPVTHSGKPKPLYFNENKDKYKDFNITHLIVDDYEQYMNTYPGTSLIEQCRNAQRIENHQRDFLFKGIEDVDPETIVLLSDADELVDLTTYRDGLEGSFMQYVYCYYLNVYTGKRNGKGPIAIKQKNIYGKYSGLNHVRNEKWHINKIRTSTGGLCHGWHFTCLGSAEEILYKIDSCYHQNFNVPEITDFIKTNKESLSDPYIRDKYNKKFFVEMPGGPKWMLDNINKYDHLIYKENNMGKGE